MGSRTPHAGGNEPSGCSSGSKPGSQANLPDQADNAHTADTGIAPGLHLVATPIGNLRDITLRALDTLHGVDCIACEDTRVTGRLLVAHGISTPLTPYHEHNAARARPALIERLQAGGRVALVADAGTPLVSDPGYKLVRAAIDAGIPVSVAPGPSAPLAALSLSGLPTDRFLFVGFLPPRTAQRRRALATFAAVPATLVLFETAPRLLASLADMAQILGNRPAALCRELTKLYEEARRGPLAELAAHYQAAGPPKGEIAIVIGPPPETEAPADERLDALLNDALATGSLRDAAETVAVATGLPRRRVYTRALAISKARDE